MAEDLTATEVFENNDSRNKNESKVKRKRKTRQQRFKEKQPKRDFSPIVKDNANLVKFYKSQPFFKDGEFENFMEGLKKTLPASFRINTFDLGQANFLKSLVQGPEFRKYLIQPDTTSDEEIRENEKAESAVLEPLVWYPNQLGWQFNVTRLDLKKIPLLQQLHRFLMAETDNGFISRQEAVSMIPPLLLDVRRGQDIMDMCAAPGSKTAQLLEYLKYNILEPKTEDNLSSKDFDDGLVVANDIDNKRCYMLVHQSSRLNSPNCVIINQDAARLPKMKTFATDNEEHYDLKFDRILCDVPCAGDGTIRKNPDVWMKWSVGNSNNFHGMQSKILRRGVELLKKDGLLVYSTCSMNPVEDEAVIASILRSSNGGVVLEDIADKLPGLKYIPGVSDWVVMNRDMMPIPSVDKVAPEQSTQLYPSLFPPSLEERRIFNLNKCMRILPHLQNTGGFFVAVLRKLVSVLPWEETVNESQADKASNKTSQPSAPKKARLSGFKENPFIFIEANDPDWLAIKTVYGFSDSFPVNQLVHRCIEGKKRNIYVVSKRARSFIIANREEDSKKGNFVKIINVGMRIFSRAETDSGFRVCQDGINEILPYIKDDIKVPMSKKDLDVLLKTQNVPIDQLSFADNLNDKIKGSFILIYKYHPNLDSDELVEMPLVAWRGQRTVALYVSKTYRIHLCALVQHKIGDDTFQTNQEQSADEPVECLNKQ